MCHFNLFLQWHLCRSPVNECRSALVKVELFIVIDHHFWGVTQHSVKRVFVYLLILLPNAMRPTRFFPNECN